ncbi:MAG: hypothetical protein AAF752_09755, partial [Bacteroidota bacterium]
PFSGKTDPQILREVLEANGLAPETVQSILKDAVQAYTEAARADLSVAQVEVYPGVAELIGCPATPSSAASTDRRPDPWACKIVPSISNRRSFMTCRLQDWEERGGAKSRA